MCLMLCMLYMYSPMLYIFYIYYHRPGTVSGALPTRSSHQGNHYNRYYLICTILTHITYNYLQKMNNSHMIHYSQYMCDWLTMRMWMLGTLSMRHSCCLSRMISMCLNLYKMNNLLLIHRIFGIYYHRLGIVFGTLLTSSSRWGSYYNTRCLRYTVLRHIMCNCFGHLGR